MNDGSPTAIFLVIFREALEASLIVGIILTAMARLGQKRYFPIVMVSVLLAVTASLLVGIFLMKATESAQGAMKKWIEGTISMAACAVLTYMIFWMDGQSRRIKSELEAKVEEVLSRGEFLAIASLPFLAVFREGAETVLFLSAVASENPGRGAFVGGALGLLSAVAIVCVIFVGGKRIPLRPLFRGSGFLLLLMAAGLLAYGIHEFHEIGVIPEGYAPVWNINPILNEKAGIGAFLKSLFGYNGNPSLVEVVAYALYFSLVLFMLSRKRELPIGSS